MTADSTRQFQVDLRGVVDLLSRHIYSSPRVYLRELLQNGRDAITARREVDGRGGTVRVTPISDASDEFVVRDDGIGLTADQMTELLATVGRSSKRDIFDLPRQDYLGQFGIGLLSCFMVADDIVIRSKSATGGRPVLWTGRSDGTFTVEEVDEDLPVGTSVHLRPRFDQGDLLRTPAVLQLAETFAEFLPIDVRVDLAGGGDELVTRPAPFVDPLADPQAAVEYGTRLLGTQPFAMLPLDAPGTGTRGTAYVLPYAPPPGARQATRVYLGRMLLSERVDDLLPDWAFFARAVVDSAALSPTASREALVEDESLEHTRAALGQAIRRWILDLGLTSPNVMEQFVAIHEVSLKALALHDEELAGFILRWLSVETTLGRMTFGELTRRYPRIRFAESVDEYRQVASVADQTTPLVNGGYLYDADLIRMLPAMYPAVVVEQVDVLGEFDRLDPPPLADRALTVSLEERATAALEAVGCAASVRSLPTSDVPALYLADPAVLRRMDRDRARGVSRGLWSSVLDSADEAAAAHAQSDGDQLARLCLNWSSDVVRGLAAVPASDAFDRTVHLLYVQALLAGQRPLTADDRRLMTGALSSLVHLSADQARTAHADEDGAGAR